MKIKIYIIIWYSAENFCFIIFFLKLFYKKDYGQIYLKMQFTCWFWLDNIIFHNLKKNPGVWHPHDKFFYDVVKRESGVRTPIALRSLVGIVPLLACLNIKVSQLQSKSGKNIRSHLDELLQKNSPFVRYVYLLTFA